VNLPLKGSTMNTPTSVSNELSAPTVQGLHHFAWRCRDAEETRHFYEDLIGLPLVHVIRLDHVPSTGEYCPYVHIFFEMGDGSYIAFFDLGDDVSALPSPNTPAWVNHIALQVDSLDRLMALKARLEDAGVDVLGVTDHHIVKSIYFFDPNGFRVELTVRTVSDEDMKSHARIAHADLAKWVTDKAQLRASATTATTATAQGN
jgi:catechol 2,3-dioxygenase-like lactoylglutathione lyase family enzyme